MIILCANVKNIIIIIYILYFNEPLKTITRMLFRIHVSVRDAAEKTKINGVDFRQYTTSDSHVCPCIIIRVGEGKWGEWK
jgi:hypothetical protein